MNAERYAYASGMLIAGTQYTIDRIKAHGLDREGQQDALAVYLVDLLKRANEVIKEESEK